MQLTHYKRIALIFSVFFLFMFTLEAMAVEKSRAGSKSSSALTKQKPATQKKKTLTTPQRLGKSNTTIQKKKPLTTRKGLSKSRTAVQKKKTQPDLGKLRTPDSKKRKFTTQRGLGKSRTAILKKKTLTTRQGLAKKKIDSQKRKAFPPMLTGKIDKRQTLSINKKPMQALKKRTRKPSIGKEDASGLSKVVVIPGGGMTHGGASPLPDRVKPEDLLSNTGMDLGVAGRDAPLIETESPLEEAEKMRQSLNEVQVIGGLDGRNDAQDGGGATTPGAALPEGVGEPTGMVGDETTGSGGVVINSTKDDGVVATPGQKATAKRNKYNMWGGLSKFFTGTGNSEKGKAMRDALIEQDKVGGGGPMTLEEAQAEIKEIQESDLSDDEKTQAMTELAADVEAKKKAAGETDPESGGERPETIGTASLDDFTNKYQEDKQKAMAGADIDYGDKVDGATNELNQKAAKELPEQVTGQYGAGHQPAGTPTEKDKQRLLDAADQGTKF